MLPPGIDWTQPDLEEVERRASEEASTGVPSNLALQEARWAVERLILSRFYTGQVERALAVRGTRAAVDLMTEWRSAYGEAVAQSLVRLVRSPKLRAVHCPSLLAEKSD